ncbi:MFS transporter, partial [Campylobacter insulaenigrae]|nr:MFS transporter [Campylobacter insulaenigrae]
CIIFSLLFGIFGFFLSFYDENFIYFYLLTCFSQGIISFAPIFMTQIFSTQLRSSGLSFAYNISYAILGFITPLIVNFIYKDYFSMYIIFVVLASLLSVFVVKNFKLIP